MTESQLLTHLYLACCETAKQLFLFSSSGLKPEVTQSLGIPGTKGYHSSRAEEAPLTPVGQAQSPGTPTRFVSSGRASPGWRMTSTSLPGPGSVGRPCGPQRAAV